jgi:hypothetical protein
MAKENNINKNNFEKYLKYFEEGRLDEKLSEELMCFIETNQLIEEGQLELVLRADRKDALNVDIKQNLLQINTHIETITASNIHYYLNSKIEGLLDQNALDRLEAFLSMHPQYRKEIELSERIKLIPDTKVIFPNKTQLKQKQTKFLWPIIAAAACFAGLIIFSLNFNNESIKASAFKHFVKQQHDSLNSNPLQNQTKESSPNINVTQTKWIDFDKQTIQSNSMDTLNFAISNGQNVDTFNIQKSTIPESNILIEQFPKEVRISSNNVVPNLPLDKTEIVLMNNPIHPITSSLSYLTQQEIDFRIPTNASEKKGSFFLKIGKLEISHVEN